ncbi:MAG: hypothetical protein MRY74_15785 [Neomegalonema sp.]|nr:hypothetical protein [Neomegalonema sp.]
MIDFAALQPWFNVGGHALSFVGTVLLAFEWRIALRAEQREAELAAQEARRELPPSMPRPTGQHHDTFAWMDRQRKASDRALRARTAFSTRSSWFTLAFVAIALGFLLQIVGAIPT